MPEEKIIFTYSTCDYLTYAQWEALQQAHARLIARKHDRQRKEIRERQKQERMEEIKENIAMTAMLLVFFLLHFGMFIHWLLR